MRMTQTEAKRRAAGVVRAMPKWCVYSIKKDGTVVFEIRGTTSGTYIEFAPEHWAAFDAVCNS